MAKMLYQGHGSYRFTLEDGTVVYVDPFAGEGYDVPANLVLVTHEHFDHNQVDQMPHAPGCRVLRAADFQPAPGEYRTFDVCGVHIQPVQACNENHPVDECVGLVLSFDGLRFYASGDTSTTDDMRSGKLAAMALDYAVFPGDGFYNMSVEEASDCAALVGARHSMPVHLVPMSGEPTPETLFDEGKAQAFHAEGRIIVHPGQELDL